MAHRTRRHLAACALAAALCPWGVAASAGPPAHELARIERLIVMLGSRADMRFLRNGKEHDSDAAVAFLRGKLRYYGDDIKTAEEFIDKLASRSSTTGQLYWVRLSDGRQIPAGDFLRIELARLDKAASAR